MIRLVSSGTAKVITYDAGNLSAHTSISPANPPFVHTISHNMGRFPFDVVARGTSNGRHYYTYTRDDGLGTIRREGVIWGNEDENTVEVYLYYITGGVANVKLYFR